MYWQLYVLIFDKLLKQTLFKFYEHKLLRG